MTDYFAFAVRQAREAAQTAQQSTRTVRTGVPVRTGVQDSAPLPAMRVIYTDRATGARVSTLVVDEAQLKDVARRANGGQHEGESHD